MKQRITAFRAASPWLIAIYLLLSSIAAVSIVSFLVRRAGSTFHTVPMLICLVLAVLLHLVFHEAGHYLVGRMTGFEFFMLRLGSHSLVRESGEFVMRELTPESLLLSVVMAKKDPEDRLYTPFFLGGAMLNLSVSLLAFILLFFKVFSPSSVLGALLYSLLFVGIYAGLMTLLPAYHGLLPNDGMRLIQFLRDPLARDSYVRNMAMIRYLSSDEEEEEPALETVDLLADDDDDPMSLFRASYLLRTYEQYLWAGNTERASHILASLYFHITDFPEEWQNRIMQEAIFFLCLSGSNEENDLADRLVTPGRRKYFEDNAASEAKRSLYFWSLHHQEMQRDTRRYSKKAFETLQLVPFAKARKAWKNQLYLAGSEAVS